MFFENRNISSKIKRSKVTDFAALKLFAVEYDNQEENEYFHSNLICKLFNTMYEHSINIFLV